MALEERASNPAAAQGRSASERLTRIRQQRDRFMGFAFSGSDLMVETDSRGKVQFSVGAIQAMVGMTPEQLRGKLFASLFVESDRPIIKQLVESEFSGQRWGPVILSMVAMGGRVHRQVSLSALRPRPDRDFVSFTITPLALASGASSRRKERDGSNGLLSRQGFVDCAVEAFSDASAVREFLTISVVTIEWISPPEDDYQRLGSDARSRVIDELLSSMRLYAVSNLICQVSETKYALVHVPPSNGGRDLSALQRVTDSVHSERLAVTEVHELGAREKLSEEEFFEALRYTLSQLSLRRDWNLDFEGLSEALEHKVSEAVSRISWFKRALLNRDVSVVGMPIVDLETRAIHHYEVNVRFQGDESPAALIAFAEEIGIIHELDFIIAELALAHLNGPKAIHHKVSLAVNLSGNTILSPAMVPRLINLMGAGLSDSSRIMFELTESFKIEDLTSANEAIQKLRRAGYRVCLDDLDSGAASLEYMEAFEVDFIKLDGPSLHLGMESRRHAMVVEALVRLSNRMRAPVIAEMIETEEQAQWAASIGAAYGQGWLFGKPLPMENISGRVLSKRKPEM